MPRIPLLDILKSYGGDVGFFAGFETIMSYGDPFSEHMAVRSDAALFDISHMGRILVEGTETIDLLDKLLPKDLKDSSDMKMVGPTAFLNDKGGFKDDVMLYRFSSDRWLIVCNAINREKIYNWLQEWASRSGYRVSIRDITTDTAMLALQGPSSPQHISMLGLGDAERLKPLEFLERLRIPLGTIDIISRSGWTGEDGFEIIASPQTALKILEKARSLGIKLAGLIARDSLRLEMGYVLYGEDIDEDVNPLEARYWVYTRGKKGCIGCEALGEIGRRGVSRVRYMFRLKKGARLIPRKGYRVLYEGEDIGYITSGTYSPYLDRPIAMGYVKSSHALPGMSVDIEIRGRLYEAKMLDYPLIKK
jgi:aminomethyltransferase